MTPQEKQQLDELFQWKKSHERQQIVFPVDIGSTDALKNTGFLIFQDKSTGTVTADKTIKVNIAGQGYQINVL